MAVKNIEMQKKNADGTFDIYHPKTKASMVIANNGSNLESHLADNAPHQYGNRFEWRYNSATDSLDLVVIE